MEQAKTIFLLTLLTILFVWLGGLLGGQSGMIIALVMAGAMNFYSYFFSHKMVLAHYKAVPVDERNAPELLNMVRSLTQRAGLPMPGVYIIPDQTPNAFATGRNPEHAAVAVTDGLLNLLDENEIKAVIAHELSHVKHYDILIGTVAATVAGAISVIANIMQFGAMFGGGGNNRPHPLLMLALSIIMPIAAMMVQMAVSRSREYMADEGAARMTGRPEWLQSALSKLESYNKRDMVHEANQQTAHMFIINPFTGKDVQFANLFRTHPTTQERIARLEALKHSY